MLLIGMYFCPLFIEEVFHYTLPGICYKPLYTTYLHHIDWLPRHF